MKNIIALLIPFIAIVFTFTSKEILEESFKYIIIWSFLFVALSFVDQINESKPPKISKKWLKRAKTYIDFILCLIAINISLWIYLRNLMDFSLLGGLMTVFIILEAYMLENTKLDKFIYNNYPSIQLNCLISKTIFKLILWGPIWHLITHIEKISKSYFLLERDGLSIVPNSEGASIILALSFYSVLVIVYYMYIKENQEIRSN